MHFLEMNFADIFKQIEIKPIPIFEKRLEKKCQIIS